MKPKIELFYSDERGEIYHLVMNKKRISLLHTNKGCLRGADIHPHKQFDVVLKGKITFIERWEVGKVTTPLKVGDCITIKEGNPHYFESMTDSWVLEWWDGAFKSEYYEPYRRKVRSAINARKKAKADAEAEAKSKKNA